MTAASATALVADERAFDLGRAQPIARHLDHVVDAADDPNVAILVLFRTVAGQIPSLVFVATPVLLNVAIGIAENGAQHRRPRRAS